MATQEESARHVQWLASLGPGYAGVVPHARSLWQQLLDATRAAVPVPAAYAWDDPFTIQYMWTSPGTPGSRGIVAVDVGESPDDHPVWHGSGGSTPFWYTEQPFGAPVPAAAIARLAALAPE